SSPRRSISRPETRRRFARSMPTGTSPRPSSCLRLRSRRTNLSEWVSRPTSDGRADYARSMRRAARSGAGEEGDAPRLQERWECRGRVPAGDAAADAALIGAIHQLHADVRALFAAPVLTDGTRADRARQTAGTIGPLGCPA